MCIVGGHSILMRAKCRTERCKGFFYKCTTFVAGYYFNFFNKSEYSNAYSFPLMKIYYVCHVLIVPFVFLFLSRVKDFGEGVIVTKSLLLFDLQDGTSLLLLFARFSSTSMRLHCRSNCRIKYIF